jgi:hypothetical protein
MELTCKIPAFVAACVMLCVTLCGDPALALHSGLTDARRETVFSRDFLNDYQSAQNEVRASQSAEPMLRLLEKYARSEEQAELELSIGIIYGQRPGLVDPAKAVIHFSNALQYELPEKTSIEILLWRGSAFEQLEKLERALMDYLRGLLACSYHDLSGESKDIKRPKVDFDIRSDDPTQRERARDYRSYWDRFELRRFLIDKRFYFVEGVKRIRSRLSFTDNQLRTLLEELTPDTSRYDLIVNLINTRPSRQDAEQSHPPEPAGGPASNKEPSPPAR